MIKTIKSIDIFAWVTLALLISLSFLSQQNYFLFTEYPAAVDLVVYSALVLALCALAGPVWRYMPRITDWVFSLVVAGYLYKIWPHTFFDDAGFIMRYLDQLAGGYWFNYNAGEGPVFGISGFLHGLYSSVLVKFLGMQPERALHVSNLTGLVCSVYFLVGIFRYFLHKPVLAYGAAFVVACYSKTWADVLFTGMETPLHMALVLGAFYFLLYNKTRLFYLFAALAVISKLDAVPVMAVLLLFHAIEIIRQKDAKAALQREWKPQLLYFWLPLALWIAFSYAFFGSPLPQSAKAKMLYHSGAVHSFFPFLEGFSHDVYKAPMLVLLVAFFIIHLVHAKNKGLHIITRTFGFGWMFVGIMVLYFFYNPNERMLWYYALPDLLLTAQCILSATWLATQAKDWKAMALPVAALFAWIVYLKPDVDGGRNWMFDYLTKVESERYNVGQYIARDADREDKLLAWHGLLARPFPGYVLDGTGLNSKKAVELKLNRDSILAAVQPTYGMHHGFRECHASFAAYGYSIKGMFADITLLDWPAWIWWEKSNDTHVKFEILHIDSTQTTGRVMHKTDPLKVEGRSVMFDVPVRGHASATVWFAYEGRGSADKQVGVRILECDSVRYETEITVPKYGAEGHPSLYTAGYSLPLYTLQNIPVTNRLNIEFTPRGLDTVVKINNPIIEYRVLNTPD